MRRGLDIYFGDKAETPEAGVQEAEAPIDLPPREDILRASMGHW